MIGVVHKRTGTKALYDAACWVSNGAEEGNLRDTLHALLDKELDIQARYMQLSRMMTEMGGS